LGDYTLNTTVTGTPIESAVRSASADTLLPRDVPKANFSINGESITADTIYQPLTGGQISSMPIKAIHQGSFGDCFFLAALTSTFGKINKNLSDANSKESTAIKNAISIDGTNYTVRFYNNQTNQPETRTVDNQVLTTPKKITLKDGKTGEVPSSLHGASWTRPRPAPEQASGQPIWGSVFERAGKRTDNIDWKPTSSNPEYQLLPAANYKPETSNYEFPAGFDTTVSPDQMFTTIKTTLDGGGYVTAGTPGGGDDTKKLYGGVLYQTHAYSVHNAYEEDGQKLILLRNPHGIDNANGDNSSPVKAAEDPSNDLKDGFITIKFDAFLKNFDSLRLLKA
jgi:hypothetical protein